MNNLNQIENISQACLNYLTSDPQELNNFMQHAGYDSQTLRNSIGKTELNAGLMDYFASNEQALLAMCAMSDFDAKYFMRVWQVSQNS